MTSGSIKNPDEEAEHPAPMPKNQQGQGHAPRPHDAEGRQGGQLREKPRAKVTVHSDATPGTELDGQANVTPVEQRTDDDRRTILGQNKRK